LAHRTHLFAHIAAQTLVQLRQQIDAGVGKTAYHSYVSCIERYFVPYFGERQCAAPRISNTTIQSPGVES
jgi:hypothetical protein